MWKQNLFYIMDKNEKYKQPGPIKIYPTYLDKNLKCCDGRKVALMACVENPVTEEIRDICNYFGLDATIEKGVKFNYFNSMLETPS